ncbi:Phospholipase A2 domain superfamily [Sesbania bispinosa]|nr:Phospholipase A2 domain superfamily [Sesbania bispinosa]
MNLGFLDNGNIPWVKAQLNTDSVTNSVPTKAFTEQAKQESGNDPKLSGWPLSFLALFPWANSAVDKFQRPSTINKELKRHAQTRRNVVGKDSVATPLRFRPYVCKVPWHTGVRAFLSQLFPRYGHYCGPNWSSGKDKGSLVWDKRPIDWLDYCCYCHDIGYDTHDQAKLLKADLAFLECLEKRNMSTKGDPHIALLYKTMCINGLKNFLIPYRRHLVNLQQSGQPLIQFGWLSNLRWRSWNFQKT